MAHDSLMHETHPLIGHRVRDTASGQTGQLNGVVREPVGAGEDRRYVRVAFIRLASGIEFSTAADNIEAT
ncbi:hypothetical protein [Streptomyces sp. NPDC050485]|uniref:hypothetical protein n=1 Tax=Streptomyces sp. NPDC050485 TaxID=3365617 RepID=UPI0037B6DB67